ncbi:MAG: pseudaminic acid cytidylyltransferase [Cyclobacteriaceae bacterium]
MNLIDSKIAIIPARSGSKRIINKNTRLFNGKPIISYAIEIALQSKLFDEVMVSTDSDEIANISVKLGASVPFLRSSINSDDFATTSDVLSEVITKYESTGKFFKYACCIYATTPLLAVNRLTQAYDLLIRRKFDVVYPAVKYGHPIQRAISVSDLGKSVMLWPENMNKRSQDLTPSYHDAGQFYWFNWARFKLKPTLINGENIGSIILEEQECQDIDTEEDWKIAELKAKFNEKKPL